MRDDSVTFRFTKPEGAEAQGSDITVSLYAHINGDEHDKAYLGAVTICR